MTKGILFIIAAPSGGGKTSLVNALLEKMEDIVVSISHTTRPAREGEIHGENYFFISHEEFEKMVEDEKFLEHAFVFNHYYGTSTNYVLEKLASGIDVILEIDWQGAQQVRENMEDVCSIFILPPSKKSLFERLVERGQDDERVIKRRMDKAIKEISHYDEFDYLVVNDNFNDALNRLEEIIQSTRKHEKIAVESHQELINNLLSEI